MQVNNSILEETEESEESEKVEDEVVKSETPIVLLSRSKIIQIGGDADEAGEPIDTLRIERERQTQGLKLHEAGATETITDLDPNKVVIRFDFWLSDAFKDASSQLLEKDWGNWIIRKKWEKKQ
ncbi:hypothetical protein Glove_360g116 [Diversispora epigaea]|uniref:Uncharacterized protein n=1 Tax=Diversispora epigaea TaxID=1348612 RepID=A0A397HA17_9GLOM|nr:hypothetical protein Glove_360g116 [Diversispora epigaea]